MLRVFIIWEYWFVLEVNYICTCSYHYHIYRDANLHKAKKVFWALKNSILDQKKSIFSAANVWGKKSYFFAKLFSRSKNTLYVCVNIKVDSVNHTAFYEFVLFICDIFQIYNFNNSFSGFNLILFAIFKSYYMALLQKTYFFP